MKDIKPEISLLSIMGKEIDFSGKFYFESV